VNVAIVCQKLAGYWHDHFPTQSRDHCHQERYSSFGEHSKVIIYGAEGSGLLLSPASTATAVGVLLRWLESVW
jgi:hypothetical protein